jgi:hypothetical protein
VSNQATRLAEEAKRAMAKLHDAAMTVAAGQKPLTNLSSMQRCWFDANAAIDALLALVQPAVSEEAVADLYQHSETGRTRVVMRDAMSDHDAAWLPVGPLVLARAQSSSKGDEGMQHE